MKQVEVNSGANTQNAGNRLEVMYKENKIYIGDLTDTERVSKAEL